MASACKTYAAERLSAFVDGDLSATEAAAVRAHTATCPHCTAALADLRAMVANTSALDAPEPPPTLWPSIEGALDHRERFAWLSIANWRPFALGALAGAAVVALVVVGLRGPHNGIPAGPPGAELVAASAAAPGAVVDPLLHEAEAEFAEAAAAYERSIGKLRALLAREEARWSPQERTRMAERMGRLDDAIARSRELARRTPGDSAGNEQLFAAYQQKIAFLAAAVHRGGEAGEWDKPGAHGR
ncbi:MAG TPA: zf-HC2 domain-containing protein [Polyangia bacterium]|jgi:predicted anti-sigma-YlaC factor YlaD|nr:zf-HC2 domain-containing protein [Polyangia bacterium]